MILVSEFSAVSGTPVREAISSSFLRYGAASMHATFLPHSHTTQQRYGAVNFNYETDTSVVWPGDDP
jgi:hypothetical protein